jgi:hypothetical protein
MKKTRGSKQWRKFEFQKKKKKIKLIQNDN